MIARNAVGITEADNVERELLNRRDAKDLPNMLPPAEPELEAAKPVTLGEYLERWLDTYAEDNPTSRTPRTYRTLMTNYVIPVIGDEPLQVIDDDDIRAVFRSEAMTARKGTTRLHVYRVLSQSLTDAVKKRRLAVNPCIYVKAPKADAFEPHVITLDEGRKLIELSKGSEIGTLVHLLAYTGLRLGEALGLRWQDVDFENATIHVRQTRKVAAPVLYGAPKTASSMAPVPLVSTAAQALQEHRDTQREQLAGRVMDHDLVFLMPLTFEGMTHDFVTVRWHDLRKRAGVPKARLHDLRHFTGTLLINLGVDPVTVAAVLRHSSPVITMTRYAHVVPDATRKAVERLEAAMTTK
jgi:integrase